MLFHRTLPLGNAPPVESVTPAGIEDPVYVAPFASLHSIWTAGFVIDEKSMSTAIPPHCASTTGIVERRTSPIALTSPRMHRSAMFAFA